MFTSIPSPAGKKRCQPPNLANLGKMGGMAAAPEMQKTDVRPTTSIGKDRIDDSRPDRDASFPSEL